MKSVVALSFALLCSISAVAQTAIKPPKETARDWRRKLSWQA